MPESMAQDLDFSSQSALHLIRGRRQVQSRLRNHIYYTEDEPKD